MCSENFATDELTEKVSCLSVSLSKEASCNIQKTNFRSKSFERKISVSEVQPLSAHNLEIQTLDSVTGADKKERDDLIVLSDSETEEPIAVKEVILTDTVTGHRILDGKTGDPGSASQSDSVKKKDSGTDASKDLLESIQQNVVTDGSVVVSQDKDFDRGKGKPAAALLRSKAVDSKRLERDTKCKENDSILSHNKINVKKSTDRAISSKEKTNCKTMISKMSDILVKEIVRNTEDDPLESAFEAAKRQQSFAAKSIISLPKRQVIQLKSPFGNRSGRFHRLEAGMKRFKPPRLDDWYRPILELDYFATVGLASSGEDGSLTVSKLKEVPVCFQSSEQYVEIFRPLVLEEFKAQLHSSFLEMSLLEEMYFGSVSVMLVERVDDFHMVRFVYDDNDSAANRSFSENDLVLLTKEPLQKSLHEIHMVGKVCPHITS